MPFTFSHPAIILPLVYLPGKCFSLTGLVIGSLTPDFEYFIRMKVKSNYSHTIEGLLFFNLPLGLILAFIFHNIVRDSLVDNLPAFLQSRFSRYKKFNWNQHFKTNWYVVVISLIIGAASHILWDGFTHENAYFVQTFSGLSNTIYVFGNHIPIFRILQHVSTLLGGLLIAYAIYKLPTENNTKKVDLKYWGLLTGLILVIILVRFLSGLEMDQYGNVIVSGITAILLGLILTPLILDHSKNGRTNR